MPSQNQIEDLGDKPEKEKARRSTPKRTASSSRQESDLRKRLGECMERIANVLDERGDDELSEIIAEDGPVIAAGLVSLTRPFVVLRLPLLALVAIVEPALAFGRIARVLMGRWVERRTRLAEQQPDAFPETAAYPDA